MHSTFPPPPNTPVELRMLHAAADKGGGLQAALGLQAAAAEGGGLGGEGSVVVMVMEVMVMMVMMMMIFQP